MYLREPICIFHIFVVIGTITVLWRHEWRHFLRDNANVVVFLAFPVHRGHDLSMKLFYSTCYLVLTYHWCFKAQYLKKTSNWKTEFRTESRRIPEGTKKQAILQVGGSIKRVCPKHHAERDWLSKILAILLGPLWTHVESHLCNTNGQLGNVPIMSWRSHTLDLCLWSSQLCSLPGSISKWHAQLTCNHARSLQCI